MNGWELIKTAVFEEKKQKKFSRMNVVLMSCAVILVLLVHSIVGSIQYSTESLLERPYGRVLYAAMLIEDAQKCQDTLEQTGQWEVALRGSEPVYVEWQDSVDYVGEADVSLEMEPYFEGIDAYQDKKVKPEYGEVIVPKKLYDMGTYGVYQYADGSRLVGENITINFKDSQSGEILEETLRVVGCYDNVESSCENIFFVNEEQVTKWFLKTHTISEQMIQEQMESFEREGVMQDYRDTVEQDYGGDENLFWQEYFEVNMCVYVYVKPGEDMEKAAQTLKEKFGGGWSPSRYIDPSLISFLEFIVVLGNIIAFIVFAVALVNSFLMIFEEFERRQWKFALKKSQGYTQPLLLALFLCGKTYCYIKSLVIGTGVCLVTIVTGNYMIQHIFPIYLSHIYLEFDGLMELCL